MLEDMGVTERRLTAVTAATCQTWAQTWIHSSRAPNNFQTLDELFLRLLWRHVDKKHKCEKGESLKINTKSDNLEHDCRII